MLLSTFSVLTFLAAHGSHAASVPAYPYPPAPAPAARHRKMASLPPAPLLAPAPLLVPRPDFRVQEVEPYRPYSFRWDGKYPLPSKWSQIWEFIS